MAQYMHRSAFTKQLLKHPCKMLTTEVPHTSRWTDPALKCSVDLLGTSKARRGTFEGKNVIRVDDHQRNTWFQEVFRSLKLEYHA